MKKYFSLGIIVLCCIFIKNIVFGDYYCYDGALELYKEELYRCKNYGCVLRTIPELQHKISVEQKEYDKCVNYNTWIEKYNKSLNNKDYGQAIRSLEQAKKYADSGKLGDLDSKISYRSNELGNDYLDKGNYSEAIIYYKKSLAIYETSATLYNLGIAYSKTKEYKTALSYLNKAKQKTQDMELYYKITTAVKNIELLQEEESAKKSRKTNDKRGYLQYYLSGINIFEARDKLPTNKYKVVIAVIDEGVNLNHPDLKDKMWINKKEIDGDGIDNDKNGYIDDYNGWDFILNTKPTIPSGPHGTMVAGIMAANTDNMIGIAGIVPNIEIMPLKVGFDSDIEDIKAIIIEAINYAIDNGADIINLSLTMGQFSYDNKFDSVIKKANDKGVIVVIAAGNGDFFSLGTAGVNTSVTKTSPVCNESNKKMIIGVGALNKNGIQAKWSNYGSCVDFYMYGDSIISTSITFDDNPYRISTGTSFSAPIVAGIVGLGYNKFGRIKPDVVYDNLKKSLSGNVIDAAKYLDNLSASIGELKSAILWLSSKGFTKAKNADEFKYSNGIKRAEAAKIFVMYANRFNKNKIVNSDDKCKISDLSDVPLDLRSYVINACRYGLFKGGKFRPNSNLTNAEAVTAFMRMYSGKKSENGNHYADKYFIEAYKLGLIDGMIMGKQKNYERGATRGDMAILLYRGANLMSKKK